MRFPLSLTCPGSMLQRGAAEQTAALNNATHSLWTLCGPLISDHWSLEICRRYNNLKGPLLLHSLLLCSPFLSLSVSPSLTLPAGLYQQSWSMSYCHALMWFMSQAVKSTYLPPIPMLSPSLLQHHTEGWLPLSQPAWLHQQKQGGEMWVWGGGVVREKFLSRHPPVL